MLLQAAAQRKTVSFTYPSCTASVRELRLLFTPPDNHAEAWTLPHYILCKVCTLTESLYLQM